MTATDRANRLLSMGGAAYAYDGLGNRVQQTVGADVTKYLLDLQPSLAVVLAETQGANTTRYVHGPKGIHAHKDSANNWEWMVQDGLGSVRSVADNDLNMLWTGNPEPFCVYFGESGTRQSPYLFTGEYTDPLTQLVHLHARDYNPALGVFPSLDPFEGTMQRPMSLNGYSWVEGNVPNAVDPTGRVMENPGIWDTCLLQENDLCEVYPGWRRHQGILGVYSCANDRTLYHANGRSEFPNPRQLASWWNTLTPTERELEVALAGTNSSECRQLAPFDHLPEHTYGFVIDWITRNQSNIQLVSTELRVDPALVAGILATEMLFDYSLRDKLSDQAARFGIDPTPLGGFGGFGYANAHHATRVYAYQYLQPLIETNAVGPVNSSVAGNDLYSISWLLGDWGAITTTAVVARWLADPYTNSVYTSYETAKSLSADEMAIIFTAYRAGVGGWSPPSGAYAFDDITDFQTRLATRGLPCNARLARPLMAQMENLFP